MRAGLWLLLLLFVFPAIFPAGEGEGCMGMHGCVRALRSAEKNAVRRGGMRAGLRPLLLLLAIPAIFLQEDTRVCWWIPGFVGGSAQGGKMQESNAGSD